MRIKKKKSSMAAVSIIVISLLIMISMALIVRMHFLQKTEVTGNPVIIIVLAQNPARAAPGRIMDAQCLRDARKDRRLQPIR